MPEWAAEIEVDEDLVRRLVAGQFPQLGADSLRFLAEGWDNAVWVADGSVVFRFPRRAVAVPGVRRELAVLPRLTPLLPLPVPNPVYRGTPAEGYPWPFFGSPLLPGREASDIGLGDAGRSRLARPLGRFLNVLHSDPVLDAATAVCALPVDSNGRADMARRVPRARQALGELEQLGLWRAPASVLPTLEQAERLSGAKPTALVHGDLHFRHLLLDDEGDLAGVIDWGDVCRADPSVDLQLVWSFVPPAARESFFEAYGPVPDEQLTRARVLAFFLCAALAKYGHVVGLANVEREALDGLARAAQE